MLVLHSLTHVIVIQQGGEAGISSARQGCRVRTAIWGKLATPRNNYTYVHIIIYPHFIGE